VPTSAVIEVFFIVMAGVIAAGVISYRAGFARGIHAGAKSIHDVWHAAELLGARRDGALDGSVVDAESV